MINNYLYSLGLEDSDDEDIEKEIENQIETMMAPKRKEVTVTAVAPINGANVPTSTDKLELAKRLAARIQADKNLGTDMKAQFTAEAVMKGNVFASQPKVTVSFLSCVCNCSNAFFFDRN